MRITKTTFFLGCLVGGIGSAVMPLLIPSTHAETKLLPFQGRLTDAAGAAIPDGAKVVEFKLYDAPTGGNVKWAGEVHKLSINGGLVNTMLGSKASLGSVDFSTPCYLQITVDANTDNQITAADPPLLPRQSVVPSVYASVAGQMQYVVPASGGTQAAVASKGWDAVFDNGNPETGRIPSGKLAVSAVDSTQVLNGTLKREDFSEDALSGLIPTGVVLPWAGAGEAPYQPPTGWMLCKGQSIGKPGSGATYANDDASALYQLIWNQWSPVTLKLLRGIDGSPTVPGLSAAADWAANKQLILPDMRGRVAVGAGTSPGLTPRVLGAIDGEETHEITESEMPEHRHSGQTNHGNPMNYRAVVRSGSIVSPNHVTGYSEGPFVDRNDTNWPLFDHTHNFITNPSGGGVRMNIMQPSVFLQYIIKL